ncbi:hypothetical protein F5Y14DRAFT_437950 [Nemania sp. NC0429]|nr:hypothetical protein F5Y14DRAFT_437950 [Nemania sp. NC0429]
MYLRETAISHVVVFIVGTVLGLLVTRLFTPSADSESCRKLGIEAGARSCSSRVPSMCACTIADLNHAALELFAQSGEDEARQIVRINGTYNKPSAYRGPPSREVDTAWERYWKTWMFGVDEKAYLASRPEHPSAAVRLSDGQYLATFEATHQLHCLYNLFRASYRDYYPEEQADYEENGAEWHERVDHCVEVLRQKLECDRDTTILTYNWVKGRAKPVLNFNAARICPSWDPMDKFAERQRAKRMPKKPKDAVELARIP